MEAKQNQVQGVEEELKGCEQQLRESRVCVARKKWGEKDKGRLGSCKERLITFWYHL